MGKWQVRAVSAIVVAALGTLPVIGTVCAVLCVPAVSNVVAVGDDYASVSRCLGPVAGHGAVRGTSGHDCSRHDAKARETRALWRVARTGICALPRDLHVGAAMPNLFPLTSVRNDSGTGPPGASPTRSLLVLRV